MYKSERIRVIGKYQEMKGEEFPSKKILNKSKGLNPKEKPIPPQGSKK